MRFFPFEKRVGVVGMYRSGKTVFMTSLLNHLKHHDPDRFPLGDGSVRLRGFKEKPLRGPWSRFEYDQHREQLHQWRRWPVKSRHSRAFRLEGLRSDWQRTWLDFTLMDMPGERLADFRIAKNDYPAWSDEVCATLSHDPDYRDLAADYLALLEKGASGRGVPPTAEALCEAYRRVLARCVLAFLPMISPSSLLLGPEGDYVAARDEDGIVAERYLGLSPDKQFAPLPEAGRQALPHLARQFGAHYEQYRDQAVKPLAGWLAGANMLVVLVDVSTILAGGLGMYHGAQHLIDNLLEYVDPGRGLWGKLFAFLSKPLTVGQLSLPGVTRVAFVASKADKVPAGERQQLVALLKSMVGRRLDDLKEELKLKVGYFACAAVKSTATVGQSQLEGQLVPPFGQAVEEPPPISRFTPSVLPREWPADWPAGKYRFPDVLPQVPARRDLPPDHIGLNRVADFLLAEDDWLE